MKKLLLSVSLSFLCLLLLTTISCNRKNKTSANTVITEIGLKQGELISCGPPDKEFGSVGFETTCSEKVKKDFNLALALLHSFEYDEAEKAFAKVINEQPDCAMAYWGVAMSNYHPLWAPPTQPELEKGAKTILIAQSLKEKSSIETDYINAIAVFYENWNTTDHGTRSRNYEKAMERIYIANPTNKEAAVFYCLALVATADPADKSYAHQKKAGNILTSLYPEGQDHPGIVHYIIHTFDYPELAVLALPAARKYASIAPSSAHAQHMPSHIFTRLGLWDECILSNIAAAASAKCYAETAGIKGHWDEELHALDYLVYGYLQKGDNVSAKKQWDYLTTIREVEPLNFKVLYAFAAIPSRYVLENKLWKDAATLQTFPANFPWAKHPWQKAIIHFTRLLGSVHLNQPDSAKNELKNLKTIYDTLMNQKDTYKANQVMIQIKTGEAWILFYGGNKSTAVERMGEAAVMEDKTGKHPVTPGEVLPARELLGDMLLLMNKPAEALLAYEENLISHPNRFNGLFGAAVASERINDVEKATGYYRQLIAITNSSNSNRPELESAKLFVNSKK